MPIILSYFKYEKLIIMAAQLNHSLELKTVYSSVHPSNEFHFAIGLSTLLLWDPTDKRDTV